MKPDGLEFLSPVSPRQGSGARPSIMRNIKSGEVILVGESPATAHF